MKSKKELQAQAAFGPKIGQGKVDPGSPGARLANIPVKHKGTLGKVLAGGLAFTSARGLAGKGLPNSERVRQIVQGTEERALGGLTTEFVKRLKRMREEHQREKIRSARKKK